MKTRLTFIVLSASVLAASWGAAHAKWLTWSDGVL